MLNFTNFLLRSDQQGNSFYSMLSIVLNKKIWEESKEIHIKDIILINANVRGDSIKKCIALVTVNNDE